MINWPTSVEHALESRFGPVATRSKKAPERRRANGAASDHKEGHGQEEADDAADEAPNAVTTSTTSGCMSRAADHLGLHEVLHCQVGGAHHHDHDGSLAGAAVAEGPIEPSISLRNLGVHSATSGRRRQVPYLNR